MKKPNFFIPGAAKSGTTSCYSYLRQHPDVFASKNKEISYFTEYMDLGEEWYLSHFEGVNDETIICEASTGYMKNILAAERIYEFNPEAKLLFMLRNPVDRAFSNYVWEIQNIGLMRKFENVFDKYLWAGEYHAHITRFLKYFDRTQMMFVLFEEYCKETEHTLRKVCQFLGVSDDFKFDHSEENRNSSKMPRSRHLQRVRHELFESSARDSQVVRGVKSLLRNGIDYVNHTRRPDNKYVMNPEIRTWMIDFYKPKMRKMGRLIGKDLSNWYN